MDALPDPELPVIGLGDLGVVHSVGPGRDGALEAHIMPTFLGCPAMDVITSAVREVLEACGHPDGRVRVVLAPPWTSDRITPAGRDKLAAHGIVPPSASTGGGPARLPFPPSCPHCGSRATRPESLFGPTRCQTVGRCLSCHETFSQFITL
ncbi:1,2-phenylacetyl-CoA epoxidase subunit PaaD [Streptomyces humi]